MNLDICLQNPQKEGEKMSINNRISDTADIATALSEAKKKLPPARAQELEREISHIINVALLMQHAQSHSQPEQPKAG